MRQIDEADIRTKINQSKVVIRRALESFSHEELYLAWTGHKDSTAMLWLFREVSREMGCPLPRAMLIDDGFLFEEALDLMEQVKREWNVMVLTLKNTDVLDHSPQSGDTIRVAELNRRNRQALKSLGFTPDTFVFSPDSLVCTHLMKTVTMEMFIESRGVKAVATAIRRDEHEARSEEDYFSPRTKPDHTRIHPMLHFTERDIWNMIEHYQIPACSLYAQGYRSLGAKGSTTKTSDTPRWDQDLDRTPERGERDQEKEEIMARLRAIGYM